MQFPAVLTHTVRGRSRSTQSITAPGRTSALAGLVINDWRGFERRCRSSSSLLIYVQFLFLTLHREGGCKWQLVHATFKCSVSSEWAISLFFFFAAVTAMNILTLSRCLPFSFFLQCKLEQQACLTGKDLSVTCTGFCPCATSTIVEAKRGKWPFLYLLIRMSASLHPRSAPMPSEQDFNILTRTNQPSAWIFGSIFHQFQRLLLS